MSAKWVKCLIHGHETEWLQVPAFDKGSYYYFKGCRHCEKILRYIRVAAPVAEKLVETYPADYPQGIPIVISDEDMRRIEEIRKGLLGI